MLQALYTGTAGASWTNSTNWNGAAGTQCTWFGVVCTVGDTNVNGLNLFGNNLTGSLPATFNQLTVLRDFEGSSNQISGAIPELTDLAQLRRFAVRNNTLSGAVLVPANTAAGSTCTVTANKAGDAAFSAAPTVQQSIVIGGAVVLATSVPTLGDFGLIALMLLMGAVMRRRSFP